MATFTAPTFRFAAGDTLVMPVTYRNPPAADGTPGDPIDLTGKEVSGVFYASGRAIPLTVENGSVTVAPADGEMRFVVDEATSATFAPDSDDPVFAEGFGYKIPPRTARYPNRLQVRVREPDGEARGDIDTIALFPVQVYDPATVDLADVPTGQVGTVVAGG